MPKSPMKDYTAILEQSRTKKKQDSRQQSENEKYSYLSRKFNTPELDDTRTKLQLALRHNARLLEQNATLSEMANSLRFQLRNAQEDIQLLRRQHEDFLKNSAKDRETLIMEAEIKSQNHEIELKKLLEEISNLHEQKNNLQIQKTKQIETIKAEFEKSLLLQMQNIKNVQSSSKQLYEVQIQSLKQQIKKQQNDLENIQSIERLQKNRLKDQISSIENEMKHLKQKYEIDLKELQRQYQQERISQKRRFEQEKEIDSNANNLKLKKMKKQLLEKAQDLEIVNKRMYQQEESANLQSINFKKDKENLLAQLTNNEINFKTVLIKEKTKLEELSRLQIQNLTRLFQTNIEQLQSEVNRLRLLIDCKTQEIKDSYEQNRKLKQSFTKEVEWYRNQNTYLKERLQSIQLEHKQEEEALKIRLAQLIESNMQQISSYFQKELSNLAIHNRQISILNKDLKDKIYKLIEDNDQLRRTFELQISKYKTRIQEYKIKIASLSLEHKEHVGSLVSRVEMTSQTLIREGESKDRAKAFYEQQRRKFHALANQKDQQISQLFSSLQSIKQMHEDQLRAVRAEKDGFKQQLQKLEEEKRSMKEKLEQQLRGKDEKLKSMKLDNQKEIEEIKDLENRLGQSQKDVVKLRKTIDHLNMVNQSLAQELGLKKGFIETLQLESNAAIQEEKTKIKILMGTHEVTMREYFEQQIKTKNLDIETLQRKIAEKQEDIRELILKYNALEKRFEMAMDAQDKIREFEQKIRQLGLDNNLVKNMAELFQKKKA